MQRIETEEEKKKVFTRCREAEGLESWTQQHSTHAGN